MTPNDEKWLPVPDYEGYYEVSDLGRVRSLERRVGSGSAAFRVKSTVLKPNTSGGRYPTVTLHKPGVKGRNRRVHVIVAGAFLGPRPDGMEVCHNNGDRNDSRLENLRYGTHVSNMRDAVLHGTAVSKHPRCRNGHAYTPDNTRRATRGTRECLTCRAARLARFRRRRTAP